MSSERNYIARGAEELDGAHHVLVTAINEHLAAGGTWASAFEEWSNASGHYVNRLGIHGVSTFRHRFAQWVTSYEEAVGGADAALGASRKETR
jgi:hypothetical protein